MRAPDLAGFQAGQDRLREAVGQPVTFERPVSVTFAPDVPIDPETDLPFDPVLAHAAGSAIASASASCNVAHRTQAGNEAEAAAAGWMENAHILVIGAPELEQAAAASATAMIVRDTRYAIIAIRRDPGLTDRTLVYGRQEGAV